MGNMMTLLNRIDPAQNMNRWYLVSVQTTLFSSCEVVIAWGRRDTDFQQWRSLSVDSRGNAEQLAAKIIQHKLRRGYQICEQKQI
jgi:predicted DNA-binding WGR domain protein